MTAYEIIKNGFSLVGERLEDFADKQLALSWLNTAISHCFDAENLIRERKNIPLLTSCPKVEDMSGVVDMDGVICTACLTLAVASLLCADREKEYLCKVYDEKFTQALSVAAKGVEKPIADFYKGGV